MIWHITKRELYDNLNNLRFAIATFLLFALMLTNAIVHLREHPSRMQKYHDSVTESMNRRNSRTDLYSHARRGPGLIYRKPSSLSFCATDEDIFYSGAVHMRIMEITDDLKGFWQLDYRHIPLNATNIRPETINIDWRFVIGYVLSLIAILFTFDSISGERGNGTLRLMLANSVPRHTVLIGKFLGALASISIPFILAMLTNLLIISTSSKINLDVDAWGRLLIIFIIALLYTSLFLVLGMFVSSVVQQSAASLVILLFAWVTFVVFLPSTLASIVSGFSKPMTKNEYWERLQEIQNVIRDEYNARLSHTSESTLQKMRLSGEYVTKAVVRQEALSHELLDQQHAQFQLGRSVTRISPVAIVQHLIEIFSQTGFERHLHFIENAQRYAQEFRGFIEDMDRADPESLHIIGVREGMSQKPVNPEAIPKFDDTFSLNRDINAAAIDLFLLLLLFVVLLSGAYMAFVRIEV